MHTRQIEKLNSALGNVIDQMPVPILYYDANDGTILRYNKPAEKAVLAISGLTEMPHTIFGNLNRLSFVADKMRKHEEFEFYVIYDKDEGRFVPLTRLAGASPTQVLIAHTFNALDNNGEFIANGLSIRTLSESCSEIMSSDLQSERYNTLTKAFGMTELKFHPKEMTLDISGGRDQYSLKGAPLEQVSKIIHPDDAQYFIEQFADAAKSLPESLRFKTRVYSIKLKGYRHFKLVFFPQIDSLGNTLSYDGFCIDVTEEELALLKKFEEIEKLEAESADSKEGERNIINALANITHDMRNPMGIIMGFSEMMAVTDDPEKREKYNKNIQYNAKRLLQMVGGILNLNRIEFGNIEVQKHTFDIAALLHKFVEVYTLQFKSKGLPVLYKGPKTVVNITTDDNRLTEILDNYMSNALKYTEKGDVTVWLEDLGEIVRIHVIDTGKGISEEGCQKVFNRFEKLNTTVKGNGIGLNICQGLAHALGGEVGVSSQIGVGSDFWVTIPKNEEAD